MKEQSKTRYALAIATSLVLAGTGFASAQTSDSGVLDRSDGIYIRCATCGTVESITQNIGNAQGGGSNTAATITGSVVGGVLGNQVGRGKGRRLATAGGVVGGGMAGNAMANSNNSQRSSSTVRVKLGNGSFMNVTVADASDLRVGDLVEVDPSGRIIRLR
ncbi:MAG: glycine zipper 2TM domain-containing protein [Proteobacteria bacterium]|nr:glycine zipper 2TM domain-containing protein [Pseudomonadota bacterium]